MNKKAISPVIATVLLVSLVVILAAIIFLWARAFLPETLQKFEGPIEDACKSVAFDAAYSSNIDGGTITVQNNGNVPLHSIQVGIKKGLGSLEYIDASSSIPSVVAGGSVDFRVSGITAEDELIIVPVLLGKTSAGELKAFVCGDEYGKTIQA